MLSVIMATLMVVGVVIAMAIESSGNNATTSGEVRRKNHFECAVMAAHFAVRHNLPDGYARASQLMRHYI